MLPVPQAPGRMDAQQEQQALLPVPQARLQAQLVQPVRRTGATPTRCL